MSQLELCRICTKFADPENAQKLFERNQRIFLQQIESLTGLKLKNTKEWPQHICTDCQVDLEQAHHFRERCISSQAYFKDVGKPTNVHGNKRSLRSKLKPIDDVVEAVVVEVEPEINLVKQEAPETEVLLMKHESDSDDEFNRLDADDNVDDIDYKNEDYKNDTNATLNCDEVEMELRPQDDEMPAASESDSDPLPNVKNGKRKSKSKVVKKRKTKSDSEKVSNKYGDFICDQCGNHFTCRQHFQMHLQRHSGIKQIQCEVCPDKFFTHSELKRHMRRHTGEKPFACKHCQRSFSDYSTRLKHERTHTNERPFACTQCGKAFTTSYILKNHMLVHTGERSFRCSLCNRSFQRDSHLVVHYRSILHKQNEEKQEQLKQLQAQQPTTQQPLAI